jgi:hypothetical protein
MNAVNYYSPQIQLNKSTIYTQITNMCSNEIDALSDQIESAQDDKKEAMSRMRSTISSIREEAAIRASNLKSELSNLESNLVSLRKEAASASKGRNLMKRSVEDDIRDARSASRKEFEVMKASLVEEKRRLKLERWDIDSRIQRAEAQIIPVMKQLREVKEEEALKLPLLSDLRASLSDATRRTSSQVEEMKEKRKARGMFFDASFMGIRMKKKEEMNVAKSISEQELHDEDEKLAKTTLYYESLLTETEEQLRRINKLSNNPVEMSGYDSIADAQRRVDILIQEKDDAISQTEDERVNALNEAANSFLAIRDQYDATYENSIRDLEVQQSKSVQKLAQEDQRAERRIIELRNEMEKMTIKLSTLMKDEREAANLDYEELVKIKTDTLEKNVSQYERTTEEVRNVRSNLIFLQRELNQLEGMAGRNRLRLNELEEERSSFRQQMGRTMSIAISKLTRR